MHGGQRRREAGTKFKFNPMTFPIGSRVDSLGVPEQRNHLISERQFKKLVFGLELCDEVVDDDEVEGEEGAAADVDDLQAGEGEEGQLVHLVDQKLNKPKKQNKDVLKEILFDIYLI